MPYLSKIVPPEWAMKPTWRKWRCYLCRTVNERCARCPKCDVSHTSGP